MKPFRLWLKGTGLLLLLAHQSLADTGMYPNIGADITATFQYDFTRNTDAETWSSNGYGDFNPITHFRFSPDDEIWLDAQISQVGDVSDDQHLFFANVGLTINDLNYYRYADNYWLRVGKFKVDFGRASDYAPGLYTSNLTDNYVSDGVLGGTFAFTFWTDVTGMIQPITSVYFTDTTFLSRSYFQDSQRVTKSDGGPANTGQPNSFSFVVNWFSIPSVPFLELQFGYKENHRDSRSSANEQLSSLSARHIFVIPSSSELAPTLNGDYLDFVPFVEYVNIKNLNGVKSQSADYLTTSMTIDYGFWIFGITRTTMDIKNAQSDADQSYLNEVSVMYNFTNLLSIEAGLGNQKMDGENSLLFGIALVYTGKL